MAMRLVRQANAGVETSPHMTITRIVNGTMRQFGFAVLDNGEEAYIPAIVIKRYNLTDLDSGAGFKARLRPSIPGSSKTQPTVMLPLLFDDASPELVEVEDEPVEEEPEEYKVPLDKLKAALEELDLLIVDMKTTRDNLTEDLDNAARLHNTLSGLLTGET